MKFVQKLSHYPIQNHSSALEILSLRMLQLLINWLISDLEFLNQSTVTKKLNKKNVETIQSITTTVSPILGLGPFPGRKSCILDVHKLIKTLIMENMLNQPIKYYLQQPLLPLLLPLLLHHLILESWFSFSVVWVSHFCLAIILPSKRWHCIHKLCITLQVLVAMIFLILYFLHQYVAQHNTIQECHIYHYNINN